MMAILAIWTFLSPLQASNFRTEIPQPCDWTIEAVEVVHPSDCGTNDGALLIMVNGISGITDIEFTIDGGVSWQSENIFLNLPAGAFGIGVRNSDGTCPSFFSSPVELWGPDSPRFIEVESVNPSDCGESDGSIFITAEGGTGPYFYSIDAGQTWGISNLFTGLAPGIYNPMVKNADGTCPTAYVLPVEINALVAPVLADVEFLHPTDCGMSDGFIQINAIGDHPILYSIDNGANWQASPDFHNLSEAIYPIVIQNGNETCIVSGELVELTGPVAPVLLNTHATNPTDCLETNGQIEIQTLTNSSEHLFSVDGGQSWQNQPAFQGLMAGDYEVLVKNTDGTCGIVDAGLISLIDPPGAQIISIDSQNPSDCDVSDGQIAIQATGGFGLLAYSIDNGQTWEWDPLFENLPNGQYIPGIRNQDGTCISMGNLLTLKDPPQPVIDFVSIQNPTDCGALDGSIKVLSSGGSENLQYSINGGLSWHPWDWFTDLAAGSFFIAVRNLDGTCISEPSVEIQLTDPESPAILEVASQPPGNCGAEDGFIKIFPAPGYAFLQYSIDNGESWQYSSTFYNLGPGQYNVMVRNENGHCLTSGGTIDFETAVLPEIQEVVFFDPSDCELNDGQIYILSEAGNLQYSIDGGVSWQENGFYQNLGSGEYPIQVRTGESGCFEDLGTIILVAPQQNQIETILTQQPSDCTNADGSISIVYEMAIGTAENSIDGGQSWQTSTEYTDLEPGVYEVMTRNGDGTCETMVETIEILDDARQPSEFTWRIGAYGQLVYGTSTLFGRTGQLTSTSAASGTAALATRAMASPTRLTWTTSWLAGSRVLL